MESFKAIGDLRLYGLSVPVNFTCATCRQRLRDDTVATAKGSWSLMICNGCYLTLTGDRAGMKGRQQQRQKAKKKRAGAEAPHSQARAAGPRTPVVPRQRTETARPATKRPANGSPAGQAELPALPSVTSPRAPGWRRINSLPDTFDPARAEACRTASRRIRLDRQLDYPCPVVLRSRDLTLTLEPISGENESLHIPFRVQTSKGSVVGKLLLRRHGPDPLPLLISTDVAEEDAVNAWACALVGFADATCFELPAPSSTAGSGTRRRSPVPGQRQPPPEYRRLPRSSRWPRHLKPEGYWAREGNWVVAAHRRRLPEGQEAGADALERARQAAIVLDHQQTWVKAHFCGHAHLAEVRFRWEPTAKLK